MFGNRTVTQRQKYALALFGMVFLMIALVSVSQKQEVQVMTGVVVELEDGRVLQGVELTTWGRIMDKLSFLPFINGTPHWDKSDTTPISKVYIAVTLYLNGTVSEEIKGWQYYYAPFLKLQVDGLGDDYFQDTYTGVTADGYRDWGTTAGAYITPNSSYVSVEEDAYFAGGYALKLGSSGIALANIQDKSLTNSYMPLHFNTSANPLSTEYADIQYPFVVDFSLNGDSIASEYDIMDGSYLYMSMCLRYKIYNSDKTDYKEYNGLGGMITSGLWYVYYNGESYTLADFTYTLQNNDQII